MRRVRRQRRKGQPNVLVAKDVEASLDDRPVSVAMIQALIPLGLRAVQDALQQEVTQLAGTRYARQEGRPDVVRWGQQRGSVFLADQKLSVQVPRVRDRRAGREVSLSSYEQLQTPRAVDVGLFRRVLGGLSCREYRQAAEAVPEAFGLAKSSVSRRFGQVSALTLQALQERRLDDAEWLVLVLDGKRFATDAIVIALGVTSLGRNAFWESFRPGRRISATVRHFSRSSWSGASRPAAACSWCSMARRACGPR